MKLDDIQLQQGVEYIQYSCCADVGIFLLSIEIEIVRLLSKSYRPHAVLHGKCPAAPAPRNFFTKYHPMQELIFLNLAENVRPLYNIIYWNAGLEFHRGNCRRGRTKCRGSLRQRRQFFAL